jgi:hypothetical protein
MKNREYEFNIFKHIVVVVVLLLSSSPPLMDDEPSLFKFKSLSCYSKIKIMKINESFNQINKKKHDFF